MRPLTRSQRRAAATGSVLVSLAATALLILLSVLNGDLGETFVFFVPMALAYATVGALIVMRKHHRLGWVFLVISVTFPLGVAMEQWARFTVDTCPGCLPFLPVIAVAATFIWGAGTVALVLVFMLFPTGRISSRGGRRTLRIFLTSTVVYTLALLVRPAEPGATMPNPIAIEALRVPILVVFGVGVAGALISAAFAIGGVFVRFRRSLGIERQQMKWIALVGVTAAGMFIVGFPLQLLIGRDTSGQDLLWNAFFMTLTLGIPVAVGIAILRHGLFDIDRIISRTVSYAMISLILGALYLGCVIALQSVFVANQNDFVVAISTLVAAALFRPVRTRVQRIVDQRFNRHRYDADRTTTGFASRLRDQIDLGSLESELSDVVVKTVQPAHLTLWIKPS